MLKVILGSYWPMFATIIRGLRKARIILTGNKFKILPSIERDDNGSPSFVLNTNEVKSTLTII